MKGPIFFLSFLLFISCEKTKETLKDIHPGDILKDTFFYEEFIINDTKEEIIEEIEIEIEKFEEDIKADLPELGEDEDIDVIEIEKFEEDIKAEEEMVCTPQCEGKECGDDGCGGICGDCIEGEKCNLGKCYSDAYFNTMVIILKAEGLPYYISNPFLSPETIKKVLEEYGISSQIIDPSLLQQKDVENKFKILIHPYGNTFPLAIKEYLISFHKGGGSIIATGVPFCHPSIPMGAKNWLLEMKEEGGAKRDTDVFHEGVASAKIEHHLSDWHGATSQQYNFGGKKKYHISGWVKASGKKKKGDSLYLRFFDANGKFLGQDGPQVPEGGEWVFIEKSVQSPENTFFIDVSLQVWSQDRIVWLDDVILNIEGDEKNIVNNPGFEIPSAPWQDLGHTNEFFGHNSIGTGGFHGPLNIPTIVKRNKDEPLHLQKLDEYKFSPANSQWIDEKSFPPEDKIFPVFELFKENWDKVGAVIAFVEHNCQHFKGAIDFRLNYLSLSSTPFDSAFLGEQILLRAVSYILLKKGFIKNGTFQKIINKLNPKLDELFELQNLEPVMEEKPYKEFFPKSNPPSQTPYVADVSGVDEELRLAIVTLQGLVNREKPQIYLIFHKWDSFWLDYMKQEGYIENTIDVLPSELFKIFKEKIKCIVHPMKELFEEPNLSVTIASVENCIVASKEFMTFYNLYSPDLKIIDLNDKGIKDNAGGLKYVWEKYKEKISHHLLSSIYPKDKSHMTRDYFYQHRVFTFWITGEKDGVCPTCSPIEEMKVMMKIFSQLPPNIPVRGFYWHGDGVGLQEWPGVILLGEFGKITVVSDGFANLSFHSGFLIENYKQKKIIGEKKLENKIYVAITMSDGDNLNTLYNYFPDYIKNPLYGTFPIGFGMGPTIIDLAPLIGQWYYKNQKAGIEYITDVSGVGYIIPELFAKRFKDKSKIFQTFIDLSSEYMNRVDHNIIRPISGTKKEFEEYGKIKNLIALFPDYGRRGDVQKYEDAVFKLSNGIPVFRAGARYNKGINGIISDIQNLVGNKKPAFVNAFVCNWFYKMEDLKKFIDTAPSDFEFVTPEMLTNLYNKYTQ